MELLNVSAYRLSQLCGISQSKLSRIKSGNIGPSEEVMRKLAAVPELNVTYHQLLAWKLMDDYPKETIQAAALALLRDIQVESEGG